MRVLFVDAEPRVLEAMARMLYCLETDWETSFCRSAEAALVELARAPHDAVVADLQTDGVALLTQVADLYPSCVRIALSSQADETAALQLAHIAHQLLAKPCATETLYRIISRAHELTRLLPDRKLQTLAAQTAALPCAPDIHRRMQQLSEGRDSWRMAELIEQDPALTSKLLQIAGSAFFNSTTCVTDVESAAMRLGSHTLQSLANSLAAPPLRPSTMPPPDAVQSVQRRSVAIARLASSMAPQPEDSAAAYMSGLLCDVGQLMLVRTAPERIYLAEAEANRRGVPSYVAELATWGATHAEVGAYLLGLWGLPFQVVEAVANHHAPERGHGDRLGLTQLVWLASCIVDGEEPAPHLLERFGAQALYREHHDAFAIAHS